MIDVSKACELVLKQYDKVCITHIIDIGYGYVISVCGVNGEEYDVSPDIVYKETGEIDVFFPPDHIDEFKNGKLLEIPEAYKMP